MAAVRMLAVDCARPLCTAVPTFLNRYLKAKCLDGFTTGGGGLLAPPLPPGLRACPHHGSSSSSYEYRNEVQGFKLVEYMLSL